jgi:hypothetical protein
MAHASVHKVKGALGMVKYKNRVDYGASPRVDCTSSY